MTVSRLTAAVGDVFYGATLIAVVLCAGLVVVEWYMQAPWHNMAFYGVRLVVVITCYVSVRRMRREHRVADVRRRLLESLRISDGRPQFPPNRVVR